MAFTVDAPTLNELLPKSAAYTIEWTDDAVDPPYQVDLYKGGIYVDNITVGEMNTEYSWSPDAGRTTGADYTIKVIDNSLNEADSAAFTLYTLTTRSISDPTSAVTDSVGNIYNWVKTISSALPAITDAIVGIYNWVRSVLDYVVPLDSMVVRYFADEYSHYVYHVDFDAWAYFGEIDELRACVLAGGSLTENINLILTNSGTVNKYPGENTTSVNSVLITRRYTMRMGILRRLWLDFTGSPTVQTRVYNDDYGSPYYKENTIGTFLRKVWRGIAGGYNRGDSFELVITNADIIKNAVVDVSIIGKG